MNLLDEEGKLFGVINFIDALVVLFVLAVVAAGATFVLQPKPEPDKPTLTTTNVTLDLGTQPDYIVTAINEGDTYSPSTNTKIEITDIHISPQRDSTTVILRAALHGPVSKDSLSYDGAPPRLSRTLSIKTDTYQVQGTIRDVGGSNELPVSNTQVLLRTTIPVEEAADLNPGKRILSGGQTVATVQNISVYGTKNPEKRLVYLGLSLRTLNRTGLPYFADTAVREGVTLTLPSGTESFEGTVRRVGSTQLQGTPATRTVNLRMEGVVPERANNVRAGMVSESVKGKTIARILNVKREPATVVLTSDNGQIYQREHPIKKDVTLRAEMSVRQTATGLTFKGQPIQQGSVVVLDFGDITIRATVVSL